MCTLLAAGRLATEADQALREYVCAQKMHKNQGITDLIDPTVMQRFFCSLSFMPQVLSFTAPVQPVLRSSPATRIPRAASMCDSEGNKVREPKTFDASDASSVTGSVTVEYKKRPFGVLAYAPSTSGKGAMIWKMNEGSRPGNEPNGHSKLHSIDIY